MAGGGFSLFLYPIFCVVVFEHWFACRQESLSRECSGLQVMEKSWICKEEMKERPGNWKS